MVGAFSRAVLALFDVASWAAIATAILGGVTTWSEFHGTEDKLTRYSDAISEIESIVQWYVTDLLLKNVSNFCLESLSFF